MTVPDCEICGRKRRKARTVEGGNGPVEACAKCAKAIAAMLKSCRLESTRRWRRFEPEPRPKSLPRLPPAQTKLA